MEEEERAATWAEWAVASGAYLALVEAPVDPAESVDATAGREALEAPVDSEEQTAAREALAASEADTAMAVAKRCSALRWQVQTARVLRRWPTPLESPCEAADYQTSSHVSTVEAAMPASWRVATYRFAHRSLRSHQSSDPGGPDGSRGSFLGSSTALGRRPLPCEFSPSVLRSRRPT